MRTDDFWAVLDRAGAGTGPAAPGGQRSGGAEPSGDPEPPGGPDGQRSGGGDPAAVAARAVQELAGGDAEQIVAWGRHLDRVLTASYTEDLWAAAYLINGGCSDDGFDAFRGWLIAQGRGAVSRAVRDPDCLAELPAVRAAAANGAELSGAAVLTLADTAYRQLTGAELPPGAAVPPGDPDGFWDFDDEDEMRRRLPRLSAIFLEPPAE